MQLSEAIRLGAMLHPQAFGAFWLRGPDGRPVATCALGAASVALLGDKATQAKSVRKALPSFTVWLSLTYANCPGCAVQAPPLPLQLVIQHLNDDHRWTREAIADWLAEIEALQGPTRLASRDDTEILVDLT